MFRQSSSIIQKINCNPFANAPQTFEGWWLYFKEFIYLFCFIFIYWQIKYDTCDHTVLHKIPWLHLISSCKKLVKTHISVGEMTLSNIAK